MFATTHLGLATIEKGSNIMGENQEKSLLDLLLIGGLGAVIAALFQAVRAMRHHVDEWNWPRFIVGLSSAALVGAITAWVLDALSVPREWMAVAIASTGYVGGRLLDILESELPETVQAAFDGLQKRLQDGKWKMDD